MRLSRGLLRVDYLEHALNSFGGRHLLLPHLFLLLLRHQSNVLEREIEGIVAHVRLVESLLHERRRTGLGRRDQTSRDLHAVVEAKACVVLQLLLVDPLDQLRDVLPLDYRLLRRRQAPRVLPRICMEFIEFFSKERR